VPREELTMDAVPVFGWFGKMPSTGDFISRRLSRSVVDTLDHWIQVGMTAIRQRFPDDWQRYYGLAPVWNALLPRDILSPSVCLAVVAPSFDRVGRRFPLCVIVALPVRSMLARITSLPDYSANLSRLVGQSLHRQAGSDELDERLPALTSQFMRDEEAAADDLSDIAAVLGTAALDDDLTTVPLNAHAAFPWPNLARTFEADGATSYWWNSGRSGALHRGFTHAGPLDAKLFLTLFGEASNDFEHAVPAD